MCGIVSQEATPRSIARRLFHRDDTQQVNKQEGLDDEFVSDPLIPPQDRRLVALGYAEAEITVLCPCLILLRQTKVGMKFPQYPQLLLRMSVARTNKHRSWQTYVLYVVNPPAEQYLEMESWSSVFCGLLLKRK